METKSGMKSQMKRVGKSSMSNLQRTKSGGGGEGEVGQRRSKIVAKNGLKHVLVLEFLKSNEILKLGYGNCPQTTDPQTDEMTDTIVTS